MKKITRLKSQAVSYGVDTTPASVKIIDVRVPSPVSKEYQEPENL